MVFRPNYMQTRGGGSPHLPGLSLIGGGCCSDPGAALHKAVEGGHDDLVRALLEQGASPDRRTAVGYTPLHCTPRSQRWRSSTLGQLLRAGASANARDSDGWTPLHVVARNGDTTAALLLVEHGALLTATNGAGKTARTVAVEQGGDTSFVNFIDCWARPCKDNTRRVVSWLIRASSHMQSEHERRMACVVPAKIWRHIFVFVGCTGVAFRSGRR